jgi:hypothetical protein
MGGGRCYSRDLWIGRKRKSSRSKVRPRFVVTQLLTFPRSKKCNCKELKVLYLSLIPFYFEVANHKERNFHLEQRFYTSYCRVYYLTTSKDLRFEGGVMT